MDKKIISARINSVRKIMASKNIDALVVTSPKNVTYLTGFTGEDSWTIITRNRIHLITDCRFTEQAQSQCLSCSIIERTTPIAQAAEKLLGRLKSIRTVGIEDTTSFAVFSDIRKRLKHIAVKPAVRIVESVRRIKGTGEIRLIEKAAKISWQALNDLLCRLKPGMTEYQAAAILEFQIRNLGATPAFQTILSFGPNGSRNHHEPSSRKLRTSDTILIDFGAAVNGYICDITRSFAYGRINPFYLRAWQTVAAAQKAAIESIRPGVQTIDVDAAARKVIADASLPVFGHGTGHGIGLAVHEDPTVSRIAPSVLQSGQVITIEPGIYLPGKFGIRIEDDILVTENGFKVLSYDKLFGYSDQKTPAIPR